MSKPQKPEGLDLITPLVEIIHEVFKLSFKLGWMFIKFLYRKITKAEPELKKIERAHLKSKKQATRKKH
jgi:uncharacterized membrane protein YciS (DUF1049 family)